jgi:hypothetical protein
MKTKFSSLLIQNGFSGRAIWVLAAASSLVLVSAAVALPSSGGAAAYLDGRWYHDGKPTRILVAPDGRSITITNEFGHNSDGYANGPHHLVIPSLGITGVVNGKGRRINWTNGTEWTRDANNPDFSGNLGGRWFRNGQPAKIDMASDGRNFTITNEWGLPATGYVSRSGELQVPGWRVTGRVSKNGHKISWSNGTEWTRPRLF